MANSVIEQSCNKLLIGKTLWKSLVLLSVMYGTNIINLTEDNISELQKIENSVHSRSSTLLPKCDSYRCITG